MASSSAKGQTGEAHIVDGLVSVIMPAHNAARYIGDSIASVQAQTYSQWELIIVDDHSTDDTYSIAKSYERSDERIRLFSNGSKRGAAEARNLALRNAKGEWIAFLDSDDLWDEGKLRIQLDFMAHEGAQFSYTKYRTMDESGTPLGKVWSGPRRIGHRGMELFCWPGCLTVIYSRKVVGIVQVANLDKHNDYAMWLKVSRKLPCVLVPEVLASYRMREGSISHSGGMSCQLRNMYRLWHDGEGKNTVVSVVHTAINGLFRCVKGLVYE